MEQLLLKSNQKRRNTMKTIRTLMYGTIAIFIAVTTFQATAAAQKEAGSNAQHSKIVGVWDLDVTIRICETGAPLASFKSVTKYELGGTTQVVPSTSPMLLSAHVGIWNWVGRNDYEVAFKMFRFDAGGNNLGWNIVRLDVQINNSATEISGDGVATLYDTQGNVIGVSCPTFEGTRFQ
jgi:hypothetical protein